MTWREYQTRSAGVDSTLEEAVLGQLQGRLLDFTVEESGGELVLHGLAHTYHVKQLAQCAVMNLTHRPIRANHISVERVPHRGFVSPR
jgi:hypothetical protein